MEFLTGGGDLGALIRTLDWERTPLGAPCRWPQSLRTAVSICLHSRFPILIWWGPHLVKIYNDAYRPILGAKHPTSLGQPGAECWAEIWHIIGPMLQGVMERGEATWSEDQMLPLDRYGFVEECYFTFSYSPIREETGAVGGIFCAVTETTQRVVGERRLATLRELSAARKHRSVEDACAQAAEILGRHTDDLPFALIYLHDEASQTLRLGGVCGVAGDSAAMPNRIEAPFFTPWPIDDVMRSRLEITCPAPRGCAGRIAVALPLASPTHQTPAGVLIAGVSDRRPLDDDYRGFLRLVAAQIGTAVSDARAFEAERQRAEMLAELDRAKTVFFSNVSHEFRTPLTLMLGPLEEVLARDEREPLGSARANLEQISRNGRRLLRLVNSLLDFSRIEAGRMRAAFQATDLATYTAELASVFRSAIERAGLRLTIECPPLAAPAYVDREMWEKIVLNLVSNAFKFTLAGEIAVTMRESDHAIHLAVRDTGAGIAPEELHRVFDRFHRVRGAHGRSYEGSGIGLALVQELARLHGGSVRVESTLEQGSCFEVEIPRGSRHLPADHILHSDTLQAVGFHSEAFVEEALHWVPAGAGEEHPRTPAPAAEPLGQESLWIHPRPTQHAGHRILLADDNRDMREYVRRLLVQCGHEVVCAPDGAAALALAMQQRPDLVVADLMMPMLDGLDLVRRLRADPELAMTPVIVLSARAGEEARIEGMQAGADDYLTKPFSARELQARVEAHLKMARLRQEWTETLRHRTAQFETLLNEAPIGVYLVDGEMRIRQANPIALPVFGDIPGGPIGQRLDDVIDRLWGTDFTDQVMRLFRRTLETGEPHVEPEMGRERVDRGVMEYYDWRIHRILLPEGSFGVVCYFRDISAQVNARMRIAESEERYRSIVTLITDVPWIASPAGEFATPQPAWSSYTGQSWDDYQGMGWMRALHPDDRLRLVTEWEQACTAGTPFESSGRIWHATTREWRYFTVKAVPLRDQDGAVREWVGSFTDVEDHIRAERQLERARDEALAANRAKDEFLAALSHELRTPLNPVLLVASDAADDSSLPEHARADFRMIADNVGLQARLIDDLLDLNRIVRGKVSLDRDPLDLHAIIRAALDTLQPELAAKHLSLCVELAAQAPTVVGDEVRLRQVIWNIVKNAIKFTPAAGTIRVTTLNTDQEQLVLRIQDSGIGMLPDEIARVFAPFVQGRQRDRDGGDEYGGLGLGLAIAKTLIERHGGTIGAESPGRGQGSTFIVQLPVTTLTPEKLAAEPV